MQESVRRFCPLHKTISGGKGTEWLLRCCSTARILHSERPAFACDCRSCGWVAQLAEQWTENPRVGGSIPPPAIPLKTRSVQQILQQNPARAECTSCERTLLTLMLSLCDGLPAR